MKKLLVFTLVVLSLSCQQSDKTTKKTYFDVKGYFENEAKSLNKFNPIVKKTVVENGKEEQKQVRIKDWDREFKSFIDGDINKDAWANQFTILKSGDSTIYSSDNEKINVKKVSISVINKKVNSIIILIRNKNILYTSVDTLTYIHGQYYEINKTQKIVLLSGKKYRIKGEF